MRGFLSGFDGAKTKSCHFRAAASRLTARGHESCSGRPQSGIIEKPTACFHLKTRQNPKEILCLHNLQFADTFPITGDGVGGRVVALATRKFESPMRGIAAQGILAEKTRKISLKTASSGRKWQKMRKMDAFGVFGAKIEPIFSVFGAKRLWRARKTAKRGRNGGIGAAGGARRDWARKTPDGGVGGSKQPEDPTLGGFVFWPGLSSGRGGAWRRPFGGRV